MISFYFSLFIALLSFAAFLIYALSAARREKMDMEAADRQSAPSSHERRLARREQTLLEAEYALDNFFGLAWVRDLSSSGIRLFLDKPLNRGDILDLKIKSPDSEAPALCRGRVVWHRGNTAGVNLTSTQRDAMRHLFRRAELHLANERWFAIQN